jgi:hypothetical protein
MLQELDAAREGQVSAESHVTGLQEALQRAQQRHFEQLNKERAAHSSQSRGDQFQSNQQAALSGVLAIVGGLSQDGDGSPEPAYLARMRASVDALTKELRGSTDATENAGTGVTSSAAKHKLCTPL